MNTEQDRIELDKLLEERRFALRRFKEDKGLVKASAMRTETAKQAQELLQLVAEATQKEAHDRIAGVVTKALEAVFPDPYEFRIEFSRKRGKTEARMFFVKDGEEVDPLAASGGGCVEVAAFALRLASIVLTEPPARKLLVLDEPFSHVHGDREREACVLLLNEMTKEFGFQVVMSTGLEWLETGNVIRL
jgi:DNA repair exonuclease SbcCD ATPase subunit